MNGKIVTSHVCPPIPVRDWDWCAHYDGEEEAGNYGWGRTEAEAIQDFKDNCQDDHDERLGVATAADAINDIRADLAEIMHRDAENAVQTVSLVMSTFGRVL